MKELFEEVVSSEAFNNFVEGAVVMDNSTHSNASCPRQLFYSWVLKRVPAGIRTPLVFGDGAHRGLELYYKTGKVLTDEQITGIVDQVREPLERAGDAKRSPDRLHELLTGYMADVLNQGAERLQPITVDGPDGPELLVEKSFRTCLGSPIHTTFGGTLELYWEGKIDLIAKDIPSGKLTLVDHKTTSIMGEKFLDDKVRSNQFLGYLHAMRHVEEMFGEPLTQVCINTIAARTRGFEYKKFFFSVRPQVLETWSGQVVRSLHYNPVFELFHWIQEGTINSDNIDQFVWNNIYQDRRHCCPKFGKCPFYDVCEAAPTVQYKYLTSQLYEISNWSPHGE